MGIASKVASVVLRLGELCASVIVLGIVGNFISRVAAASASSDARLIYAVVVASMSTFLAVVFVLPFLCAFLAFPADLVFFVLWLVVFSLLIAVSSDPTTKGKISSPWHGAC